MVTCNTATGPEGTTEGEGEDVIFNWGIPGTNGAPSYSPDYPGIMIKLADCPTITGTLGDISLYGEVIIDASLYASEEDFTAETKVPITQADGKGQFKILESGDWESELFPQKNNMNTNGETSTVVPAGKSGTPVNVLVQTASGSGVGYIEIRKLTFKKRTSDVALEVQYNEGGTFVTASGNQLTFTGAIGTNHAAKFVFPADWGTGTDLQNKTITFTYTIEAHTCDPSSTPPAGATVVHQLHIQAAQNQGDYFNGQNPTTDNPKNGQLYLDLDEATTFSVSANDLIKASEVSTFNPAKEGKGPFTLDTVRIINDGTTWTDTTTSKTHYRCKSYTLIINSVTISP